MDRKNVGASHGECLPVKAVDAGGLQRADIGFDQE